MTTFLLLLASHAAAIAAGWWLGWDTRRDVEWNRRHKVDS